MKTDIEVVKRKCEQCGSEFEAHISKIGNITLTGNKLCDKCGEMQKLKREQEEKEHKEYEARKLHDEWRVRSGIPLRFRNERFETYKVNHLNKKAFSMCKEYADNFPIDYNKDYKSLGIFSKGVWGVGKTHLACAIGHVVIDKWSSSWRDSSPVYYVTEPELFTRIRSTFNHSGETELEVYKQLANVPLLIIDDIGKEDVSDPRFVQRVWFTIINQRYDNLKPVVFTANLNPDELANHLGGSRNNEASFDRLLEMMGGVCYEIQGKSYRREKYETIKHTR